MTASSSGSTSLDVAACRDVFPILAQPARGGKRLVYLDSAATTQKPRVVIDAIERYYREQNANVHRAIHVLAERATEAYEDARVRVAKFIGAPSERSIIYTRGTTESINLVAYAWGDRELSEDDEILISEMEHHSNLVPWQLLAQRRKARLRYIPVTESGELDRDALRALLTPKVKLVALTHASNVLGTVNPVREITAAAHAVGAKVLIDAAQSVPHFAVNVQELDCDFLAFSGHKMCAPTGIGILYGREALLEAMNPFHGGGEMINKVALDHSTWADLPHKFEAGTPNISGAVGLGAAVAYLESLGMAAIDAYEQELTAYALEQLKTVPGLTLHGAARERVGSISFSLDCAHPHDVAHFLDQDGIAIRAGHMCAQPLMKKRGVTALSRISVYFYNTRDEIDAAVKSLRRVQEFFSRATR